MIELWKTFFSSLFNQIRPNKETIALFLILFFAFNGNRALAADPGFTYQGTIIKNDGKPLNSALVEFVLRIGANPTGNKFCLLYEEKQTADFSESKGQFSLILGRGTPTVKPIGITLPSLFNSQLIYPNTPACDGGYSKQAGDKIYLQTMFNDGTSSGWQTLDDLEITATPYTFETLNVAGLASANVVRLADGPATPITLANFNDLIDLINGVSPKYQKTSGPQSVQISTGISNSHISLLAPPSMTASYQLTLPATAGSNGQVLTSDGAGNLSWSHHAPGSWNLSGSNLTYSAGNVGIGTTSPTTLLEVAGTGSFLNHVKVTDSSIGVGQGTAMSSYQILMANPTNNHFAGFTWAHSGQTLAGLYGIDKGTNNDFDISVVSMGGSTWTEKMRILANGNVGIGTSTPANKLDVAGNINANGVTINGVPVATSTSTYWSMSGGKIYYNSGYVGIGTVAPTSALEISTADSTDGQLRLTTTGSVSSSGTSFLRLNDSLGGAGYFGFGGTNDRLDLWNYRNGPIVLAANNAERMRIDVSGNVGIGTSAPTSALEVNGNTKIRGQIVSGVQTFSNGNTSIDWNNGNAISTDNNCGSSFSFANLQNGGTYTLVVTESGTTQCNFSTTTSGTDAGTITYKFKPANAPRTANSHTVYTFMRVGNAVYVSWASGFQ